MSESKPQLRWADPSATAFRPWVSFCALLFAAHVGLIAGCQEIVKEVGQDVLPKIDPPLRRFELDGLTALISVSPDGKLALVRQKLDARKTPSRTFVFDLASGEMGPCVGDEKDNIQSVSFSPDGKRLLIAPYGGALLFDRATKQRRPLAGNVDVSPLRFSPNGRFIVGGGAFVWDQDTGKMLHQLKTGAHDHAVGADGHLAALTMGHIEDVQLKDHVDPVQKIAWDVHIWHLATGEYRGRAGPTTYSLRPGRRDIRSTLPIASPFQKLSELGFSESCFWVRVSPAGKLMMFPRLARDALEIVYEKKPTTRGPLLLRDRLTGEQLYRFSDRALEATILNNANSSALSADNGTLVAFTQGKDKNQLLVWDVSAFRKHAARELPDLPLAEWNAHWQKLADDDPRQAFKAMRRLAASPKQTLTILKERLQPVRKEKLDFAALVKHLDDGNFAQRKKAEDALLAAWDEAIPFLQKAAKEDRPLESKRRIEAILKAIEDAYLPDPETRRLLWAVELLEFLGQETPPLSPKGRGEDVKQLLEWLAQGTPTAWVTLEARKSLERLK